MKVAYVDVLGDGERHVVEAEVSLEPEVSSYGQPAVILESGVQVDVTSWVLLGYQVLQASQEELDLMGRFLRLAEMVTAPAVERVYTIDEAISVAAERGEVLTERGLRYACANELIAGVRKSGRTWLIPHGGLAAYLEDRPRTGPRPGNV